MFRDAKHTHHTFTPIVRKKKEKKIAENVPVVLYCLVETIAFLLKKN